MRQRFLLLTLSLVLMALGVQAGDQHRLGASAGATLAVQPDSLKDSTDPSLALGGFYTYQLTEHLRLRGELQYARLSRETASRTVNFAGISGGVVPATETTWDFGRFAGGVEFGGWISPEIEAVGVAMFGATRVKFKDQQAGGQTKAEKTGFGVSLGAQLNYMLNESWGVGPDIRFSNGRVDSDQDMLWILTASVGGFYRF